MSDVDTNSDSFDHQILDRNFLRELEDFKRQLAALDQEIDGAQFPHKDDAYHRRVLDAFGASQLSCKEFELQYGDDATLLGGAQAYFRRETDPWFRQSWIANRARTKPSGFAGDYEMLVKLYDEATPARGLGGYLDLCILDLPLARAVRARMAAAREYLLGEIASRDTAVRILDIASGPCREYLDWPPMQRHVDIVALDNDPLALEYVQANVQPSLKMPTVLSAVRYNALRTRSAETTIRKFGSFDIIYSVGLCDYLTDDHLVRLLNAWHETLAEGGVLYIAFKDTEQYDKTPYQWHLDWFFYQRTVQDVLDLYERAGFDLRGMQTTRDATGIITNFITHRVPAKIRRFDEADTTQVAPTSKTPAGKTASVEEDR